MAADQARAARARLRILRAGRCRRVLGHGPHPCATAPFAITRSPTLVPGRSDRSATTRFYQVCKFGIQSTVIRRECFEAVGGFDEVLPALEDLELFIRLSKRYRLSSPAGGAGSLPRDGRPLEQHGGQGRRPPPVARPLSNRNCCSTIRPSSPARSRRCAKTSGVRRHASSPHVLQRAEISVCVCTFRRPAGLLRLLRSLRRLDPRDAVARGDRRRQRRRAERAHRASQRRGPKG